MDTMNVEELRQMVVDDLIKYSDQARLHHVFAFISGLDPLWALSGEHVLRSDIDWGRWRTAVQKGVKGQHEHPWDGQHAPRSHESRAAGLDLSHPLTQSRPVLCWWLDLCDLLPCALLAVFLKLTRGDKHCVPGTSETWAKVKCFDGCHYTMYYDTVRHKSFMYPTIRMNGTQHHTPRTPSTLYHALTSFGCRFLPADKLHEEPQYKNDATKLPFAKAPTSRIWLRQEAEHLFKLLHPEKLLGLVPRWYSVQDLHRLLYSADEWENTPPTSQPTSAQRTQHSPHTRTHTTGTPVAERTGARWVHGGSI